MVKIIKAPDSEESIWMKSLKRQTGRDTGKVISNFIWGDSHASVHRHVSGNRAKALELKEQQLNAERELKERQFEAEQERIKQEDFMHFTHSIEYKIQELSEFTQSENHEDLVNTLSRLSVLMKGNQFKDSANRENRICNQYSEAILARYEHAFLIYANHYPEDSMMPYYAKILKWTKIFKPIRKYRTVLLVTGIILFILIFLFSL